MASLANQTISSTYDGLVKTSTDQPVPISGVQLLEDGVGNSLALSVGRANQGVTITGTATATAFAGPLTGNVTGDLTGSVLTAAQTNITSVGTLSSLAVSGNLTVDTNTLFVDAANNSVLVNTLSNSMTGLAGASDIAHFKVNGSLGHVAVSDTGNIMEFSRDSTNYIITSGVNSSLAFEVAGIQSMSINSSNNVKIGALGGGSSVPLEVYKSSPATGTMLILKNALYGSTDASGLNSIEFGWLNHSAAKISANKEGVNRTGFIITGEAGYNTPVEIARFLSTGGITFNGDTSTANALDDYEEGTFTPVYAPSSGSFATMTMDIITAKYTKIGNMVAVYVGMRTDDVDITGASGDVYIGGLPFVVSGFGGGIALGLTINFTNAPDGGNFINASTNINLRKNGASDGLNVSDLSNGTNANHNFIYFSGTYMVS